MPETAGQAHLPQLLLIISRRKPPTVTHQMIKHTIIPSESRGPGPSDIIQKHPLSLAEEVMCAGSMGSLGSESQDLGRGVPCVSSDLCAETKSWLSASPRQHKRAFVESLACRRYWWLRRRNVGLGLFLTQSSGTALGARPPGV